jgi:predicted phosphodiesterase
MYIRYFSDLHLEFSAPNNLDWNLTEEDAESFTRYNVAFPMKEDSETVLVVAGDLAQLERFDKAVIFLKSWAKRFKHVIYVLGNHEFYKFYLNINIADLREKVKDCNNISIFGNEPGSVIIDGVNFICGTLWTKVSDDDFLFVMRGLNDYHIIAYDSDRTRIISPVDTTKIHETSLLVMAESFDPSLKNVVVTHHMPSFSAVDPAYKNSYINAGFTSDLDDFILKHKPDVWIFGHTHTKYNGYVGMTRLLCNPFGYPHERNLQNGVFDTTARFYL